MNYLSKINKLGKVGAIICKICRILVMIAAVMCFIFGLYFLIIPSGSFVLETTITDSRNIVLHISEDFAFLFENFANFESFEKVGENSWQLTYSPAISNVVIDFSNFMWVLFFGTLFLVLIYIVLRLAGKVFTGLKNCQTPFTYEIANDISKVGYFLIPVLIIDSLSDSMTTSSITGNLNITLNINIMMVLLIVCVFLLSVIFKYGASITKE